MSDIRIAHRQIPVKSRGRDQLNLIDFPIAGLQYQQPKDSEGKRPDELVCVIDSYDRELDKVVPRKLTRRTASRHGFPTPLEDEVLVGLLTLTRLKNNFTLPRIEFRNAELFDLMGWPHNGSSTTRLGIALDRLTGLTLKYENSWTTEDGSFEKEFTTGILESYNFAKQVQGRRSGSSVFSWVQWASEVFADIQRGNVKELNTDEYFSLQLPISRRIYRFLDKQLVQNAHFEMELTTFAGHIGLSETKHIGKIKERLASAFAELEQIPSFCLPATVEQRFIKRGPGDWLLIAHRSAATESQAVGTSPTVRTAVGTEGAASLVCDFYTAWNGATYHRPTSRELDQAQSIIDTFGIDAASAVLPLVVKEMKHLFPEAKAFGATMRYWGDAHKTYRKRQEQAKQRACEHEENLQASKKNEYEVRRRETLRQRWESLSESRREQIRVRVRSNCSGTVRQFLDQKKYKDPLVMLACLECLNADDADLASL
ncbi:replication initiator protein A [Rhodopirellula sp. ICT_H3.1]|uniref:Replication initiator protein A n=1 Tax=Aporhodopirellula aestuarii TaxID=2950107 RepID=A0ABT0UCS9_9BACT|nr:replication initiator protein A [Aporhodopirellula aestuarii]